MGCFLKFEVNEENELVATKVVLEEVSLSNDYLKEELGGDLRVVDNIDVGVENMVLIDDKDGMNKSFSNTFYLYSRGEGYVEYGHPLRGVVLGVRKDCGDIKCLSDEDVDRVLSSIRRTKYGSYMVPLDDSKISFTDVERFISMVSKPFGHNMVS